MNKDTLTLATKETGSNPDAGMRPSSPQEYVSVRGAAAVLGVSEKTIRNLIGRGDLASFRIGRLIRIKRTDLIACVEREASSSGPPEDLAEEAIAEGILSEWNGTRPD